MNNMMFYFFYLNTIFFSMGMVLCLNPINAVLCLISVFVSISMLLLLCNLEFLALIFIIVYVGAIAVLFLFIVMMINIKKIERDSSLYLTVGIIVIFLLAFEMSLFLFNDVFESLNNVFMLRYYFDYINLNMFDEFLRINLLKNIGIVLFYVRPFLIFLAGLILFIAMVGAIYLTNLKQGFSLKKQVQQLSRNHMIEHVQISSLLLLPFNNLNFNIYIFYLYGLFFLVASTFILFKISSSASTGNSNGTGGT